jgi:hypothetical protein
MLLVCTFSRVQLGSEFLPVSGHQADDLYLTATFAGSKDEPGMNLAVDDQRLGAPYDASVKRTNRESWGAENDQEFTLDAAW